MVVQPADVFLSPTLTPDAAAAYLSSMGFRDSAAADQRLQDMAAELVVRETLGGMADRLFASLCKAADPDRALHGLARYIDVCVSKTSFLRELSGDAPALDLLTQIFGGSPFLTDVLVRNPEYFHWLSPQIARAAPTFATRERYINALLETFVGAVPSLNALRRLKRRELLGIAAREMLGRDSVATSMRQLSDLADMLIQRAFSLVCQSACLAADCMEVPGAIAVIATGKLGGRELDYLSGIDLQYVYAADDPADAKADDLFQDIARQLTSVLVDDATESELYRVDVPTCPRGAATRLAFSFAEWEAGITKRGMSDRFALIKTRQIAGDPGLGDRFAALAEPFVYGEPLEREAADEMFRVSRAAEPLKTLELFTQILQLTHGADHPEMRCQNTSDALAALSVGGFLTREAYGALTAAFVFLRTVAHRLQLVQASDGAPDEREQDCCARQLGFRGAAALHREIEAHRDRVQAFCSAW